MSSTTKCGSIVAIVPIGYCTYDICIDIHMDEYSYAELGAMFMNIKVLTSTSLGVSIKNTDVSTALNWDCEKQCVRVKGHSTRK